MSRAIVKSLDRETYFRAKLLEQQHRHIKYEEAPYSLEPNVKEGPGGLRDLQVVVWVARASGYGGTWAELARRGFITTEEARIIRRSERRIKEIRARLHLVTGRREDRMVFDVQDAVAQMSRRARDRPLPPERSLDATVLPRRQGRDADEHDPAAEHRASPLRA